MSSVIEVPDWYRTVALVGVDITGEPVVVLLDSTGAIMAVMKGEYAGTLKNIAVDASGRVIMIPTDPADIWGNAISMGNAELASIFSPAKRYDRRGNIFFIDTFGTGLNKCVGEESGSNSEIVLSSTEALFGDYSAKLTGGSDSLLFARLTYYLARPTPSKIGAEFSFKISGKTEYLQVDIFYYDGTNYHAGHIRYNAPDDKWQYYSSGGTWTDLLTGVVLNTQAHLFHICKLVIDPVNDKFVRALISSQEVVMSSYVLYTYPSTTDPQVRIRITDFSLAGENAVVYVGYAIFTQNEPA